jgi:preprotein translocase subunit YajC
VPIAAGTSSGSFLPLLLIIVFIFGMYFLMIRPQQKRNRELQQMQSSIAPGSEVMTGSGIYGTVSEIDEDEGVVSLEIAPDVHMRVARAAIARVISAPDAAEEDSVDEDEVDHDTDVTANPIIERKD